MFKSMFNQVDLIQKGLDTAVMRHETISNNIANVDTPDYKTKHVEFETVMRQAMDESTMTGTVTHEGHFKIGVSDTDSVKPTVVTENFHTMRMDGNNVDIDQEMNEMAVNTITYNSLVEQLNSEFTRLRTAISGQ